ncbi:MAG: HAD family hydrolase [Acidobacteriaceae bacterium]
MVQVSCDALLFDLDGVLIASTPAVERVWRRWAMERGFDAAEVVNRAHGRPSITTIREYLPDANHEAENAKVERAEIEDLEGVVPLPGALELLRSLPSNRWTIVTSCTRPLAEVRIAAAGLPQPVFFVTSSDVTNGKPHPEPFLMGASRLRFPAERCLVLEDAPAGIRAGKAARMRVIGLRTTMPEDQLQEAGADWILSDCAEISVAQVSEAGLELVLRER